MFPHPKAQSMRRSWTTREVRRLLECYGAVPPQLIAEELNRSTSSVKHKTRRYFIPNPNGQQLAATYRAACSPTVNARFFDGADEQTYAGLGFVFSCGSLKLKHRHVLKASLDANHRMGLDWFLALIKSNHCIQARRGRLLVEIGNSYLVNSLRERWGMPPSIKFSNPPALAISDRFMRAFAMGHLLGSGLLKVELARWTGTPAITNAIGQFLTRNLMLSAPKQIGSGRSLSVSWTKPSEIQQIRNFLNSEISLTHPCQPGSS